MKKLLVMLERGLMLVLAVMPAAALILRALLVNTGTGIIWLCVQTLVASLTGLLPAYVGNYSEREVIRTEGSRGRDPNPDRETVREIVKEGHRYPIRLLTAILLLVAGVTISLFLPSTLFIDRGLAKKLIFTAGMFILNASAMYGAASYCLWTEIPGMALGFIAYVGTAFYLNFSARDNSEIQLIVSICALLYLFFGGLCLNRATLATSVSTDDERKRTPIGIVRRNRRIVLGFSGAAAVVSFVGPVRNAAIWLWGRFAALVSIAARFLRGGGDNSGDTDAFLQMMEGAGAPSGQVSEIQELESSDSSVIFVWIFFGFVGLVFLWLVFSSLVKLVRKISGIIERFATGISEGYYDEREDLKDSGENGKQLSGYMRDRFRKLFARETPWDKLNPREKTRRLLREVYSRRGRKLKRIASKTAREAISEMKLEGSGLGELYDRARYSAHEINDGAPDTIRKEIKP